MRRLILSVAVLSLVATACKKNGIDKGFDTRGTHAGPYDEVIVLPTVINEDMALTNNNLYILDGKSYVTGNHTLFIDAGTRIEAVKKSTNDSASALIVTRGSQIFAAGSSTAPIVFTSHEATPSTGDWGGIVLLGNAPINQNDQTIEGINLPSVPAGVDINYGGGAPGQGDIHHNAGELSHVIIEYAGAAIAPDNELNGLTCGGVGDATVLDFIEVAYGNDDAFEFFGGTVNAKHLFALVPDDDAFDFDFGYQGHIQYAVSVLDPTQNYSANPNGIECDNNATGANIQPYTNPHISNMTVIGWSNQITSSTSSRAAHFRRFSHFDVRNSLFLGFPRGIHLDGAESISWAPHFSHSIVHAFNTPLDPFGASWGSDVTTSTSANSNADIVLNAPFNFAGLDFRIVPGTPAKTLSTSYTGLNGFPGFFDSTSYRGAFDEVAANNVNNWLAGWAKTQY